MRISTPLTNVAIFAGLVAAQGLLLADGANMRALAPGLGDWQFCMFSDECQAGCCSREYSDDGKLKCTPGGTPNKCTTRGGGGANPPPVKPKKNDWNFCEVSSECRNECCSREYSDDGKLKCTPGGSQCV